jgi:hypothetical protein
MKDGCHMYGTQSPRPANAPEMSTELLDKQLARDRGGELRDQMLDELALAAQDIEAVLGGKLDATTAQVLGDLLRAIRTSELVVTEGWRALQK